MEMFRFKSPSPIIKKKKKKLFQSHIKLIIKPINQSKLTCFLSSPIVHVLFYEQFFCFCFLDLVHLLNKPKIKV